MGLSLPANVVGRENELLSPRRATRDTTCLKESPVWGGGAQGGHICEAVEDVEGFVFCGKRFRGVVGQWDKGSHERKLRPWEGRKVPAVSG